MVAGVLHPHAYQALLDRGWRRSGRYLYKVGTFADVTRLRAAKTVSVGQLSLASNLVQPVKEYGKGGTYARWYL